jgi:hypothetical protein
MIYYVMTVILPMGNSNRGKKNKEKFAAFCKEQDKKNGKPLPKITDELWRLRLTK